jgi:hypothetical protein
MARLGSTGRRPAGPLCEVLRTHSAQWQPPSLISAQREIGQRRPSQAC